MGIGEDVEDLDLAGNPLVVAAFEAARRHLGRDAVTEVMGAAETQACRIAVTPGIDGSEQERAALDIVRRVEPHLGIDVTPVSRSRGESPLPLGAQGLLLVQLLGSGFLHGPELQGSRDPFHVEALEQTANRLGRDARAAAVDREAEGRAVQPGVRRREEPSCTLAT